MADDEPELWIRWRERGDHEARKALVERHRTVAQVIAASVLRERGYPADVDLGDLRQEAMLALIGAVDRFDPKIGVPFPHFVKKRIRGAVLDAISAASEQHAQSEWRRLLQVERLKSIESGADSARTAWERMAELAVGLAVGLMLEGTGMHQPRGVVEAADPYADSFDYVLLSRRVHEAAGRLPDPDRYVLQAHYYEDLQFAVIAANLGLSAPRVSQIHARAIRSVRAALAVKRLDVRI